MPYSSTQMHGARGRARSLECVLLLVIILLQVTILGDGRWWGRDPSQVVDPIPDSVATGEAPDDPRLRAASPDSVSPFSALLLAPHAFSRHRVHETPAHRMLRQMDAMFESVVPSLGASAAPPQFDRGWESLVAAPAMDMEDAGDHYCVSVSLPGIQEEDVGVSLKGRMLTVVTRLRPAGQPGADGVQYRQRFLFPGPVTSADEASADFTNGLLRISVPKAVFTAPAPSASLF